MAGGFKGAGRSRSETQNDRMATLGFLGHEPRDTLDVLGWEPARVNVAGIEAGSWTETPRSDADLATLVSPRLALVADIAWKGGIVNHDAELRELGASLSPWVDCGNGSDSGSTTGHPRCFRHADRRGDTWLLFIS